jgi:hypothetical protein
MASILREHPGLFLIEDLLCSIFTRQDSEQRARAILVFLHHQWSEDAITNESMRLLAQHAVPGRLGPLQTLLCQRPSDSGLSDILETMSHDPECGYVISTVLGHLGNQIVITDEIIMCCLKCCEADTVLSLLLRGKPTLDTQFFQNLTDAAVSNRLHGSSIIKSLLEQCPLLRFTITERTVAYAQDSFAALEALLRFPKDRYSVSREALFAAAGNSEEVLGLLLSRGKDRYVTRQSYLQLVRLRMDV